MMIPFKGQSCGCRDMMERDKYILWDAGEVIYRAGDPSNEAFLIMDGSVQVFTSEGLLLNRIGVNEILGETSLLLDTTRTVTAIASPVGAKATSYTFEVTSIFVFPSLPVAFLCTVSNSL